MFARNPKPVKFAKVTRREDEVKVLPHLAYDLHEVDALISAGKPVSNNSIQQLYFDGVENCKAELNPDDVRGVDMNDLWNLDEAAKSRRRSLGIGSIEVNPVK